MSVILKPRHLRPHKADDPQALGRSSFIIDGSSNHHYWAGIGSLSIKTFSGGEALYNIGQGRFRVDPNHYLILNQGQAYEIIVDAIAPFESFCLFFENGFAEEVHYSLTSPTPKLLDNPQDPQREQTYFFEKTYRHDEILSPSLFRLKAALQTRKDDELWINEQLQQIVGRLFEVHQNVSREIDSLPAMRATTREELYRRLHRAKEFIAASYDEPITLDEMAGIACLSTNHFLRTFRQAFRTTPHQFLTSLRLERAQKLLLQTDLPITDICLSVGFESLGSFSALFRRKLGLSPEKFRREKQ